MGNLTEWYEPEQTKKTIYEGIYPATIIASKTFEKEQDVEENGKKKKRKKKVVSLTFKTNQAVPFPDKTTDNIIVEQQYYFDVQMHRNALNGLARAFGIEKLDDTSQFEGKVGLIGLTNREYDANDGTRKTIAQFGWGLFSYAPMCPDAKIEYIANDIQGKPTGEQYKEWFKDHLAPYKQPK